MTNEEIINECKRLNSDFGIASRPDTGDSKKVIVGAWFIHKDQPWKLNVRVDPGGEDAALACMLPKCLDKLRELTT